MKLFEISQNKNMSPKQVYNHAIIYGLSSNVLPSLEKIIATDAQYSYLYARDVLEGRFPAGGEAIATDTELSYDYANEVLEGRFPAGEKIILKDPSVACYYAQDILHRRWVKAEPILRKSAWWESYKKYFNIK